MERLERDYKYEEERKYNKFIEDEELRMLFEGWVDDFKENNASQNHTFKSGDTDYYVRVSFL